MIESYEFSHFCVLKTFRNVRQATSQGFSNYTEKHLQ